MNRDSQQGFPTFKYSFRKHIMQEDFDFYSTVE